jgi:Mrp family chromosome partitioning ATPase
MSRNYEVLRRLGQEVRVLDSPFADAPIFPDSAGSVKQIGNHKARVEHELRPAIESLIQQLFFTDRTPGVSAVSICTIERHSERTGICARTADMLALRSGSVCIADLDLRAPSVHSYFGLNNHKGIADSLASGKPISDFGQQLAGGNLTVFSSGEAGVDLHSSAEALKACIHELRVHFDYVLIESPPLSDFLESTLVGRLVDGIVIALEANATRRETALRWKDQLERAQVTVLGTVLNNRTFPIPQAIYKHL